MRNEQQECYFSLKAMNACTDVDERLRSSFTFCCILNSLSFPVPGTSTRKNEQHGFITIFLFCIMNTVHRESHLHVLNLSEMKLLANWSHVGCIFAMEYSYREERLWDDYVRRRLMLLSFSMIN